MNRHNCSPNNWCPLELDHIVLFSNNFYRTPCAVFHVDITNEFVSPVQHGTSNDQRRRSIACMRRPASGPSVSLAGAACACGAAVRAELHRQTIERRAWRALRCQSARRRRRQTSGGRWKAMHTHGFGVYVLLRGEDSTARHRTVREACVSLTGIESQR